MESFGGSGFAVIGCNARKKRSSISRRPRPDSQTFFQNYTFLPPSTQPIGNDSNDQNRYSRNAITGSDGLGSENKLKLKLKLGGVTHTIHTKSPEEYAFGGGHTIKKSSHCFDTHQPRLRPLLQEDKDSNYSYRSHKGNGNRVQWRDFSRTGSTFVNEYSSRVKASLESVSVNETYQYEPVRKSKRVPKRRVLNVGFNDDDDEDEEIQYLGRLNASKVSADSEEYEGNEREWEIYEDKDYMGEEPTSDDEPGSKRKKLGQDSHNLFVKGRNESAPTTRNGALQSGNDVFSVSGDSGANIIDFPNGLPPAPPKKQKEKLSEVELQLKKAEAAQRRRMQSEKAAREAEAEAIRKILGQDSGRKKRKERMRKQRDELAQGKAAKSAIVASNTVRWVYGPTGTIVIFSDDIGLPNIFNSVPCSYPPPREKCAGPNCTNAYKYRDSKSKLPLCSLHCYRAINGKMQPLVAC